MVMDKEALFNDLTEPQASAVRHTAGALLVLAGAGSGKTRVITRRATHIATTVAEPRQVLAITFTNKAALEMRERIEGLDAARGMWICTFHALGARLLREFGSGCGLDARFTILDQADRLSLLRDVIGDCGLRVENWQPRVIDAAISDAKNRMQSPADYGASAADFASKSLARVYEAYQQRLLEQNACDFDDLLMRPAQLMQENAAVRRELGRRFRYLMIDEYQDTNHAQYVLAHQLASEHGNICATGDPDQSIYAWRGADISNILDFERDYPQATVVRLEQNFRSTGAILAAASRLIDHNRERRGKALWTAGPKGPPVRVWECDDERQEAALIAGDIRTRLDDGATGGNMAVFYRVNALSRVLEDALRRERIPYHVARGVEFYSRAEIKNVLAYLRAIVNPRDESAMIRAMGTPSRGIGRKTVDRLRTARTDAGASFGETMEAAAGGRDAVAKKLGPFVELLSALRGLGARPVAAVVEQTIQRSGIEAMLKGAGEVDNEPLENVFELVNAARQYDEDFPEGNLTEWLQQISLISDADSIAEQGGPVTLMTLHTAKGLEYPHVFIVGLDEGLLPHERSIRGSAGEIEEERRLCFVGMTRAKESLTLTHARHRMVRGVTQRTMASRFLAELPQDEIEKASHCLSSDRSTGHLGRRGADELPAVMPDYYPGQRVRHEEYGEGQVVGFDSRGRSSYVRICFVEHGERAFATDHVTLYVMD
jgi:DNA helicase-2/ATP-dependent DNA helicase PcrA